MQLAQAKEIITNLANGIDPSSGGVFDSHSPYNHPKTIRALFTILSELDARPSQKTKLTPEQKQEQNLGNL